MGLFLPHCSILSSWWGAPDPTVTHTRGGSSDDKSFTNALLRAKLTVSHRTKKSYMQTQTRCSMSALPNQFKPSASSGLEALKSNHKIMSKIII